MWNVTFDATMKTEKRSKNKIVSWDSHLDKKYGKQGTLERIAFDTGAQSFILGELLKGKSQPNQDWTDREIANKKSYISRSENGYADIQLSTLLRLIEQGLNRKLELTISWNR